MMRGMNRLAHVLLLSVSAWITPSSAQTRTATAAERAACESKIQEKIDAIDSKMRTTYTAREGERLKERRRKLQDQRYECRNTK